MKRRLPEGVEQDDLEQSGLLGLIQAARRYKGPRERFWEFARLRVVGSMIDELREADSAPRRLRRSARHLQSCVSRLEQLLARAPTGREIAAEMRMTLTQYHRLVQEQDAYKPGAPSSPEGQDVQFMESSVLSDPLNLLIERCKRRRLLTAVSELPRRKRRMLMLRLSGNIDQRRIASLFGVTESRVCQLIGEAAKSLRSRLADG